MLPQISLRTILWLIFAAAVAVGWGWERWGYVKEIENYRNSDEPLTFPKASRQAKFREMRRALEHYANLSDDEFRHLSSSEYPKNELALFEYSRRRMVTELLKELNRLDSNPGLSQDDAMQLTALRRAEGKPDPLTIDVKFVERSEEGDLLPTVHISGVVRNVDLDRRPVRYVATENQSNGVHDNWWVELRDDQDQSVPCTGYLSWNAMGLERTEQLKFGESSNWPTTIDPRWYVRPPPTGRYQLQLLHSRYTIADQPDLMGRIVWKSEPIWVDVANHQEQFVDSTLIRLILVIALAFASICACFCLVPRAEDGTRVISWTDVAAFVLIFILAFGWWGDAWQLRRQFNDVRPHNEADWTILAPKS